ncbi:MAG TPA: hypothetical protein VHC86_16505 [Opitutaceae bacterium]|nr:hypothetical protein [Opitutaceae bacterium]
MNRPIPTIALLFLTAAAARALVPATPAAAALPMRFHETPLGNVVRVFSARFGVPLTVEANARAPISGDFQQLDLTAAVNEAARQAGLFAIPLGQDPAAGFRFSAHPPPPPGPPKPPAARPEEMVVSQDDPAAQAARQRAALLQKRAELEAAAAAQDR